MYPYLRTILMLVVLLGSSGPGFSQVSQLYAHWESRSPMPAKRANMATASLAIGDTTWIFTFMGIDSSKSCGSGIRLEAWQYNTVSDQWSAIPDVPGSVGRIAASATGLNGKIYLIGGYEVDSLCNEVTSPKVDIYDPVTATWSQGSPVPTRIDDHVQVVWRDSLIICVSGWSTNSNTRNVQLYDTFLDQWQYANFISGPGLFGHAGSIHGDTILYTDGVRISANNFVLTNTTWKGVMQNGDPTLIQWTNLGTHPGPKMYRGGGFTYGDRIIFTGGTDNAYNIDGIGYNNVPSVESGRTWGYHLRSQTFEEYPSNPDSVMDVRQVVEVEGNKFYVVGGMSANQEVTNKVSVFVVDSVVVGRDRPVSAQDRMGLFPNPARGQVRVLLSSSAMGEARLQVHDATGRPVCNQSWYLQAGLNSTELLLPDLPAGWYVVSAISPGGQLLGWQQLLVP